MTMTSVNIRMDADIKRQADELFQELGMTMSTAMNIFVRQAIREQGIPFEVVLAPEEKELREAKEEFTRNIKDENRKLYRSAKELHDDILSED